MSELPRGSGARKGCAEEAVERGGGSYPRTSQANRKRGRVINPSFASPSTTLPTLPTRCATRAQADTSSTILSHSDMSDFAPSAVGLPSSAHSQRRSWQTQSNRRPGSVRSQQTRHAPAPEEPPIGRQSSRLSGNASTAQSAKWWRIRFFRGMVNDVKRRAPYYWSDWTDAWDYRVIPATVYMYFAKYGLLPH